MTSRHADPKAMNGTEYRINQHEERRVIGWQVNQAVEVAYEFPGKPCPAWWFWAAYWDLSVPVPERIVVAETLAELETLVAARQEQMIQADPALIWRRNRRITAERDKWPDGTLEHCETLERMHPRWRVSWEPDRGYVGNLDIPMHHVDCAAQDPDELYALMDEVPEHDYSITGCWWCLARLAERGRAARV